MAVVSRVYWKGFLRLSLVTVNVEIYSAIDSGSDISFRQIHKPSGKRVKYEKTVPGVGSVQSSDIVKGYEVDDDVYVLIEPDDIKALQLESEKSLDLVQFVDADEVDERYYERPYYVLPADEPSTEGYLVIAQALHRAGKIGLGQVTMRGREYLVSISPFKDGRGLILEILRYSSEIREAEDFFDTLPEKKLDKEMVDLATELIGRKSTAFDPAAFQDRYQVALRKLVDEKAKGKKLVSTTDEDIPRSAEIVDLMEALKKSVGGKAKKSGTGRSASSTSSSRGRAKATGSTRARKSS